MERGFRLPGFATMRRMRPVETEAVSALAAIVVNGERRDVPDGCTIEQLLVQLGISTSAGRRVAVARGRNVVPRSAYSETTVRDGDRIEILEAVGGG